MADEFHTQRLLLWPLQLSDAEQTQRLFPHWDTNSESTAGRIHLIQWLTIVWMLLEAAGSLSAALFAHSPALSAFAGDSLIELLSASVVLWRFTTYTEQEQAEHRAARIAGILLFVLAPYVALASIYTVLGYNAPKPSVLGMCVLIAASLIMPWLAFEKRRLSAATGSAALRADAAESVLCGYMAVIALVALIANSVWHVRWADPAAALAIIPFIVYEGTEAIRGKACSCCCVNYTAHQSRLNGPRSVCSRLFRNGQSRS